MPPQEMTFKLYQIYKAHPKDGNQHWAWQKIPINKELPKNHCKPAKYKRDYKFVYTIPTAFYHSNKMQSSLFHSPDNYETNKDNSINLVTLSNNDGTIDNTSSTPEDAETTTSTKEDGEFPKAVEKGGT